MHIKILSSDQLPNRASKHSVCHVIPEWAEILEAAGRLGPNQGFVVELSKKSAETIGSKTPGSYFVTQLRVHIKNFQLPIECWSNHGRICVQRVK